jgi:hypothetical protein
MVFFLRLATLVLLGTAASLSARPVDLSAFRGVFQGTVSVTIGGLTYPGTARIAVKTGARGRSATFAVSGTFRAHGKSFPISNRLRFSSARTFAERSITNGFPGSPIGVTGRCSAHLRKIAFVAPFVANHISGTATGAIAIHAGQHRRQFLNLRTSIVLGGQPADYLFDFQASNFAKP